MVSGGSSIQDIWPGTRLKGRTGYIENVCVSVSDAKREYKVAYMPACDVILLEAEMKKSSSCPVTLDLRLGLASGLSA